MTPISIIPAPEGGYDVWLRVSSTVAVSLGGEPRAVFTDFGPRYYATLPEAVVGAMVWWPEGPEGGPTPPVDLGALMARAADVLEAINTLTED